jgi:hypothetical protein
MLFMLQPGGYFMTEFVSTVALFAGTISAIGAGIWYGTRHIEKQSLEMSLPADRPIVLPPPRSLQEQSNA